MIFIAKNDFEDNFDTPMLAASRVIKARRYIILKKLGADEERLNRYLLSKYNKTLKQLCMRLIFSAQISKNFDQELIIIFQTKEDENLAKLITFGTGHIMGSQLLKTAFTY